MYPPISDLQWFVKTTAYDHSDVAGYILLEIAKQVEILWDYLFSFYNAM